MYSLLRKRQGFRAERRSSSHSPSPERQGSPGVTTSIQAKLELGAINDPLEREADRAAARVVAGETGVGASIGAANNGIVQRKCSACEEEEKVQRKEAGGAASGGGVASSFQAGVQGARASGGRALEASTRGAMESGFGRSFADVRIHVGGEADSLSKSVKAKAFTVGNDVFFRRGQYAPKSQAGKELLAHELAHTLQQGKEGGRVLRAPEEGEELASSDSSQCTPKKGLRPTVSNCKFYRDRKDWLPPAFVTNATHACEGTPDDPKYNSIRGTLQRIVDSTPEKFKKQGRYWNRTLYGRDGVTKKPFPSERDRNIVASYYQWLEGKFAPQTKSDHDRAYAASCCAGRSAPLWAWKRVSTFPAPRWFVAESIRAFGSCSGEFYSW